MTAKREEVSILLQLHFARIENRKNTRAIIDAQARRLYNSQENVDLVSNHYERNLLPAFRIIQNVTEDTFLSQISL